MPDRSSDLYRNRRRYPRIPFPSAVIVVSADDVQTLSARDLGAGGIFLHAPKAPRVGTEVRVEFDVGSGEHLAVVGVVIRDETKSDEVHPGFAVRFENPDCLQERIAQVLRDNL